MFSFIFASYENTAVLYVHVQRMTNGWHKQVLERMSLERWKTGKPNVGCRMQWQREERKSDSRWTEKNGDWKWEDVNDVNKPTHT
jgi:hypothetical protein